MNIEVENQTQNSSKIMERKIHNIKRGSEGSFFGMLFVYYLYKNQSFYIVIKAFIGSNNPLAPPLYDRCVVPLLAYTSDTIVQNR
jgi:hypothetical protein